MLFILELCVFQKFRKLTHDIRDVYLLNRPKNERPDSLAVLNENFMELVMKVLKELGLKPGKDIMLASHSNDPIHAEQYPDVEYFAFSSRKVLETAFQLLNENNPKRIKLIKAERLIINNKEGE